MYGVSYKDLAALQKRIKTDEPLAEELWGSENHDARILATKIADPDIIGASVVDSWASDLDNYVLTGAFAGLVGRTPFALTRMRRWTGAGGEWIILAGLALRDTDSDDADYAAYLPRIEQDIHNAEPGA
jgi:3-methyladenine DNA glycosylase AlkD